MDSDKTKGIDDLIDSFTIDLSGSSDINMGTLDPYYGAVPPASVTISNSGTWATTTTAPVYIANTPLNWGNLMINDSLEPSGTLSLKGKNADIDINGESLMTMIRGIQERLNILCPDPDMEAEWTELRMLREQYDAKLQECREKSKMWKALKS